MAKKNLIYIVFIVLIIIMSSSPLASSKSHTHEPLIKKSKFTHLRFFFHDIGSGQNKSSINVASAPNANGTVTFGSTAVADDLLTAEPDYNSKQIGRAQGMFSFASLTSDVNALLMMINFVFTQGKYNGSTLSMLGRNAALEDLREMSIVGGTGRFRFATGYALAKTYSFNVSSGDANIEYNLYVLH